MTGNRFRGLMAWLAFWGFRFKPATHRQAWLYSAAMLLPGAAVFYGLTAMGRVLLGTPIPSHTFLITFPVYMYVLAGVLSSWKIHRR